MSSNKAQNTDSCRGLEVCRLGCQLSLEVPRQGRGETDFWASLMVLSLRPKRSRSVSTTSTPRSSASNAKPASKRAPDLPLPPRAQVRAASLQTRVSAVARGSQARER
jgi:hypothetical protein